MSNIQGYLHHEAVFFAWIKGERTLPIQSMYPTTVSIVEGLDFLCVYSI